MFCLCPHPFTSKSHLKDTFLLPPLHLSSVEPCVQGRGRRGESTLLESHSLGGVNTVSGPPPPVVGAHQINKCTNLQVIRNMFTRVEEKQPFGMAGAVASGTAAAAWDSSRGAGKRKSMWTCQVFHFRSGYFQVEEKRVCMRERERELEREREMPKEMEREKKCRGTVTEARRGGTEATRQWQANIIPVGLGLNPVSFSQELGVLDLAPCPLRIFVSSPP